MKLLNETIKKIEKINYSLGKKTQRKLDNLTKPQGSLGRLEGLAKQLVEITRKEEVPLKNKVIFTMVGDHGVVEEGVSAFPKEVTPQMVYNFLRGGAAISVLAKHGGIEVIVVDMGIASEIDNSKFNSQNFKNKKVNFGTKNITKGPAMSKDEAVKSIESGIEVFEEIYKKGIDIVGAGDMGIGNTTPSSAIVSVITGKSAEEVTGRGTGIDNEALSGKIAVIKKAISVNKPDANDAIDILAKVGGFEIGGLAGVILAACSRRIPIVVDGFISTAAALIAYKLEPKIKDYLIAAHCSMEKGHKAMLEYMRLKPLMDLEMRLGEGTGAALSMNIIEASVKILTQMATFESASVSRRMEE